ncbi:hypothetical protein RFI_35182, partial [Reticulomyxa filosa]
VIHFVLILSNFHLMVIELYLVHWIALFDYGIYHLENKFNLLKVIYVIIVSGSGDKTIRLWEVSSEKQTQSFEGHSRNATSVQFSSGGNRILSGSDDKTIRLHDSSSARVAGISDVLSNSIFSTDDRKCLSYLQDKKPLWKCIWQGGVQSTGLSLKGSIWKDAKGITLLQMPVIEQYGGTF